MKEGFLAGGALIAVGLLLELSAGPVEWGVFAWPVNGVVLTVFLAVIIAMHLLRKEVYAFRFLSTYQAAIPVMCYAVVLTVVMGLTRQSADGRWIYNMLTFWPFVLTYVYMAVIVGLVSMKIVPAQKEISSPRTLAPRRPRKIIAALFHLGLFITMTTATLGNADMQRLKMITVIGEPEWRALDQQGRIVEMPMSIELKKFIMETYDDGSPRRFASEIEIQTKSGKTVAATVDVNKPVEVDGWKIYQYGYDTEQGAQSSTSILELVSDPWLPYVYAGIYMMLAGGVLMLFMGLKSTRRQSAGAGNERKEEQV